MLLACGSSYMDIPMHTILYRAAFNRVLRASAASGRAEGNNEQAQGFHLEDETAFGRDGSKSQDSRETHDDDPMVLKRTCTSRKA